MSSNLISKKERGNEMLHSSSPQHDAVCSSSQLTLKRVHTGGCWMGIIQVTGILQVPQCLFCFLCTVKIVFFTSDAEHLKWFLTERGNSIWGSDGRDVLVPDWLWRGLHQRRMTCMLLLCCHISPVYFFSFAVWQEPLVSAAACHINSRDVMGNLHSKNTSPEKNEKLKSAHHSGLTGPSAQHHEVAGSAGGTMKCFCSYSLFYTSH